MHLTDEAAAAVQKAAKDGKERTISFDDEINLDLRADEGPVTILVPASIDVEAQVTGIKPGRENDWMRVDVAGPRPEGSGSTKINRTFAELGPMVFAPWTMRICNLQGLPALFIQFPSGCMGKLAVKGLSEGFTSFDGGTIEQVRALLREQASKEQS